jgi:short-chain fatty acids transporter
MLFHFPFYTGIMDIITAAGDSGISLAGALSQFFVSASNGTTFAVFTFLSAGIMNLFVPSGGGPMGGASSYDDARCCGFRS